MFVHEQVREGGIVAGTDDMVWGSEYGTLQTGRCRSVQGLVGLGQSRPPRYDRADAAVSRVGFLVGREMLKRGGFYLENKPSVENALS